MGQQNRPSSSSDYAPHTQSLGEEASTSINRGGDLPVGFYYGMPPYYLLQYPTYNYGVGQLPAASNFYFPYGTSSSGFYSSIYGALGVPAEQYGTMDATSLPLPKFRNLTSNHFATGNYISPPSQPVGSRWLDHQFISSGEASGSAWPRQMPIGPRVHENDMNVNPMGTTSMPRHRNHGHQPVRIRINPNRANPHQEMRTDIDNVSYEELLALGESIGKVNAGASEETIKSQLKVTTFSTVPADSLDQELPECCSICQEEYKDGDEIGILNCKHQHHKDCLTQWLRLKNVCPLCKCEALAPSEEDENMNC